jgi:hypothetical protein
MEPNDEDEIHSGGASARTVARDVSYGSGANEANHRSARIDSRTVRAIHIPFKQKAIDDAIRQFNHDNLSATSVNHYTVEAHRALGIEIR